MPWQRFRQEKASNTTKTTSNTVPLSSENTPQSRATV